MKRTEINCVLLEHFLECMKNHSVSNFMIYNSGSITKECMDKISMPIKYSISPYYITKIDSSIGKTKITPSNYDFEYRNILTKDKRNEETKCKDFESLIKVINEKNIDNPVIFNNVGKKCYEKLKSQITFYKYKFFDLDVYPYPSIYKKDNKVHVRDPQFPKGI